MSEPRHTILRWFLLGGIFGGIHTAIWVLITVAVFTSEDGEAGMAYYVFLGLDYPIWRLYQLAGWPVSMLVVGGLLWFSIGFVIQSLFAIRRMSGLLRLMTGVAVLCFVCLLPEFSLKSMPSWQEHWHRGMEATNAKDYEKAVWHLSEAVRLAPEKEHSLSGMWDYLGRVYMDLKQYDRAEEAFKSALATATNDLNPPAQTAWEYFELDSLYQKTGDIQQRKDCLRKQIESYRMLYKGDSTQEAGCWHRLAEIARTEGNAVEAQELLDRAITIESALPPHDTFSLDYMKKQREQWMAVDSTAKK